MNNDAEDEGKPKLSKVAFSIALNTHLCGTFICDQLNKTELVIDSDGNFPPDIIGAICAILRSALGTEISCAAEIPAIRKMLDFLDPYLEPPYRPESDEIVPLLYISRD